MVDKIGLGKKILEKDTFKWMPGMQYLIYEEGDWTANHPRLCSYQTEGMTVPEGAIPDLEDPATKGCLMKLFDRDIPVEIISIALKF